MREDRLLSRPLTAVCVCALLLLGCGSSKPSYCSKVSDLKKSIQSLGDVNVAQNGPSALTSAVKTVESNAKSAVSAAKSDFPSETSAVTSSLDALTKSAQQLSGSPTPAQLSALASEAASTVTAVKGFINATSSKCG